MIIDILVALVNNLELSVYNSLLFLTGASENNQNTLLLIVQIFTCFLIAGIITTPIFIVIYLLCIHYINPKFEESQKRKIEKKYNFEKMESESDMSTISREDAESGIF